MQNQASPEANLQKALRYIEQLADAGAQIICLQELFNTLYFCLEEKHESFELAESVPGPTTEVLQALARKKGVVILAPLFEKRSAGIYHNTVSVLDADGSYLGKYRKNHIPDDPGFYEKFYFTPGDRGYQVFDTAYAKIGVLICWDQWYPEAARITSMMGADILFYPTAIGWEPEQNTEVHQEEFEAWQTMQRSHAIANGVHVVAVNRVGLEGPTQFWGGSFIANPFGKLLYQAPHHEEVCHVVELDLARTEHYRQVWPFLRDRRIDTYAPITQRYLVD